VDICQPHTYNGATGRAGARRSRATHRNRVIGRGTYNAEASINLTAKRLPPHVRRWFLRAAVIVSFVIIGAFLLAPPWRVLVKTRLIGYAVCHQLPDRSFHVAGEQLPLCARCSGTFMGAIVGFTMLTLWGRRRAAGLPPTAVAVTLVCFVAAMGVDGINSYLTFFRGLPHLYQPQNWLRLTTGMLTGIALSSIVYPVLSYSLWRDAVTAPSVRNFKELGMMLAVGVAVIVVILLELPPLLYPLAILSVLGVLTLLTALNTSLLLNLVDYQATAIPLAETGDYRNWRRAALPLVVGLAASFVEIGAIDVLRYVITRGAGLPL